MEDRTAQDRANVDAAEVDQFARQAGNWWDPHGPFRPLHKIGPVRLQFIRDAARKHFQVQESGLKPLRGLTVLDIGCGGGLISEPLARLGAEVTGIDPAPENIQTATDHAAANRVDVSYNAVTAEEVVETGAEFDMVTCLEVVEHVPDPAEFVATISKLVRPGGLLIMSTINRTPKAYALAIVGAEYILRWVPAGTHQWDKFVRPDELRRFFAAAGLQETNREGVVFNPLKDRWSLSSDTDVNYMISAAKS